MRKQTQLLTSTRSAATQRQSQTLFLIQIRQDDLVIQCRGILQGLNCAQSQNQEDAIIIKGGRGDVSEESMLFGIADKHIEDSKVVHGIIYNDWRCKLFGKYVDGRQGNGCHYCSCGYLR